MRFGSLITVNVAADSAEDADKLVKKLVKGIETSAERNGIDMTVFANFPVKHRVQATEPEPEEGSDSPETLFDEES